MSKKKSKAAKVTGTLTCECGNENAARWTASFDGDDPLARSLKYGAELLEDNDRLRAELGEHRQCWSKDDQIAYWRNRRRRFFGVWELSVHLILTPWSWQWTPQLPTRLDWQTGQAYFEWLFLALWAVEDR